MHGRVGHDIPHGRDPFNDRLYRLRGRVAQIALGRFLRGTIIFGQRFKLAVGCLKFVLR